MKPLGIILIILGAVMCIFTSVNFTKETKVVDLGPVEINKKENKHRLAGICRSRRSIDRRGRIGVCKKKV
jgi:hypothetical protein